MAPAKISKWRRPEADSDSDAEKLKTPFFRNSIILESVEDCCGADKNLDPANYFCCVSKLIARKQ